ncbi:MAG: hypothetical protein M1838_005513 [Thelocarpon superellum]|nr:MAG: hypothetical protein M1838_005513 [Thelocarpon superellum]
MTSVLDVTETLPPHPRPGMRSVVRYPRRAAGPPPPPSWLTASIHAPAHVRSKEKTSEVHHTKPHRTDGLPGLQRPDEGSLLHTALKSLAQNWEWHTHYNQYYLATLPSILKSTLLGYVAVYGPDTGIGLEGLKLLFLSQDELSGATNTDEVTHLDLSGVLGRSITLQQLEHFLHPSSSTYTTRDSISQALPTLADEPAESWEQEAPRKLIPFMTGLRFTNLTHLSLAHPAPTASWARLLRTAAHLSTLTHLSLAYWPTPCLTPNAKTTTLRSSQGPVFSYGASSIYSASDDDWVEAAGILRRLSRATYCLTWLDLEGCGSWISALKWDVEGEGIEWNGGWRRVEEVIATQGRPDVVDAVIRTVEAQKQLANGLPSPDTHQDPNDADRGWDMEEERAQYRLRKRAQLRRERDLKAREVARWVRAKRAQAGGLFCRFVLEDEA